MKADFVKSGEKKRILKELNDKFGVEDLNFLLIATGRNKIRGFSGTMSKEEIRELSEIANVEVIGCYLLKQEGSLRISLDGTMILSEQISKGFVELDDDQVVDWFNGKDIDVKLPSGVYVIKHGNDFLGCGASDGKKILNYLPKERRVRRG